jgi:archaellum component FlaC
VPVSSFPELLKPGPSMAHMLEIFEDEPLADFVEALQSLADKADDFDTDRIDEVLESNAQIQEEWTAFSEELRELSNMIQEAFKSRIALDAEIAHLASVASSSSQDARVFSPFSSENIGILIDEIRKLRSEVLEVRKAQSQAHLPQSA